jgi:DNA-binding response OmpR family regulator
MNASNQRILMVDDDLDFVEAVACFLQANGFAVSKAHSGEEGVRLAKLEKPDLILLDVMMTERTEGFFVIREIRADPSIARTPIFVLSSFCERLPDFEIPAEGGWLGHDLFLPKPVNTARLLEKIRQRLGVAA